MASSRFLTSASFIVLLLLFLHVSKIKAHGGGHDDDDGDSADAGGGDHADLHSKGLILVKVWCLIILFVSTFAGGVSPYFYRWNESFLLLGTQFAGGVFLGTALMHFLSDSASTFGDLTSKEYPFSFMLASVGYLFTMLGDCVIAYVVNGGERDVRVEIEGGTAVAEGGGKEVGTNVNPAFIRTSSVGDTILLILALCFHSVFEGIAVGVAGKSLHSYEYQCFL